jgi:dipeptidase E
VDKFLEKAMDSGVVMTGGSFGAICWFDAGHSDSMDPATYKNSMLKVDTKDMGDESQL